MRKEKGRENYWEQIIARNTRNNDRDLRAEISFEFFAGEKAGRELLRVRILGENSRILGSQQGSNTPQNENALT